MKPPAEATQAHKTGPKAVTIRQDVRPADYTDLARFIDSLGPRRSIHRGMAITYVTLMRRLREPTTLTVQELDRLAKISGASASEILLLLTPALVLSGRPE